MQYRQYGNCGFEVSRLGFGIMRMPILNEDSSQLDEKEGIKMIRYAIDHGVNYIDTAYPYHGGNSEHLVAKALQDGYRDRVILATKLPLWEIKSYDDFDKYLNEQLEKLQTDYIDLYMLQALNKKQWDELEGLNITKFFDAALADGRIKYAGFSYHDEPENFKPIVDAYNWNFCMIQLNFMDEEYQAGVAGLRYAHSKGLAVTVMEPLRGGNLTKNVPDDIAQVWNKAPVKRTPAERALRWVANHPEVDVVLSGMSTMEQLKENIKTLSDAYPHSLSKEEVAIIDEVKDIYKNRTRVNCTQCEYCIPCPEGVNIPQIFRIYNNAAIYNNFPAAVRPYANMVEKDKSVLVCIECGKCEALCPQTIKIVDVLKEAHENLTKK